MVGNLGAEIAKVSEQFAKIDAVAKATKSNVSELGLVLTGMATDGVAAAKAWTAAFDSMARSATRAGAAAAAAGRAAASGAAGAAAAAGRAATAGAPTASRALAPYMPPQNYSRSPYAGGSSVVPYAGYGATGPGVSGGAGAGAGAAGPMTPWNGGLGANRSFSGGGGSWGGGPVGPYTGGIPLNPGPLYPGPRAPSLMAVGLADFGVGEILKKATQKAIELQAAETNLLRQGWSADQVKAGDKLAWETQRDVPGSDIMSNIDLLSKIKSITQSVDEAMQLMPRLAGVDVLLRTGGHGDQRDDMLALLRSVELKGELASKNAAGVYELDPTKIMKFARYEVAASDLTHNQINPEVIHQFLQSGGTSAGAMDDYGIFAKNMALILAMGPARAGTAVRALGQATQSGKMSQATAQMWIDMGLINGGGTVKTNKFVQLNPIGNVMVKPGGFSPGEQELANSDPVAFVQQYVIPKMRSQLVKDYGKSYSEGTEETKRNYETAYASRITPRIPAGQYLAEIIRTEFQISRDQAAFPQSLALDPYKLNEANPKVDIIALMASFNASLTALGVAILPEVIAGIKTLTAGINDFSAWAHDNPGATKLAIEGIVAALGGLTALSAAGKLVTLATGLNAVGLGFGTVLGPLSLLGGAAYEVGRGLDWLQAKMHGLFSWIPEHQMTPGDFAADWAKKHGLPPPEQVIPRPWELPGSGASPIPAAPSDPNDPFANPSRLPGPMADPNFHKSAWTSYAPRGNYGDSNAPIPVVVTNDIRIGNGRDLIRGISNGQADLSNRPPGGISGSDPRINASRAFYGGTESV